MIRTGSVVVFSLFFLTISLVLLGVIMVLSASQFLFASSPDQNVYEFMGRQLMWLSLGLACLSFFAYTDFNIWERWARWILLLNIVLLAAVLFTPLGVEIRSARRWLRFGINLGQPSDLTKLAVIIYLAAVWAERKEELERFWQGVFFPMCLAGLALGLILLQPDHGTVAFIGALCMVMWFAAGGKLIHMLPVIGLCVAGFLAALYSHPGLFERIIAFLNPEDYRTTKYFQVYQAMIGFAHGGMWGVGLGEGVQQLGFTPDTHTDFIFSVIGEELGFVNSSIVLLAYLGLVWTGYYIAVRSTNPFGSLLAVGCTTAIGLQAAMNIAVVTGSMPTTGIPLPFISYGGSALMIFMSMIGILISIARETFDTGFFGEE